MAMVAKISANKMRRKNLTFAWSVVFMVCVLSSFNSRVELALVFKSGPRSPLAAGLVQQPGCQTSWQNLLMHGCMVILPLIGQPWFFSIVVIATGFV